MKWLPAWWALRFPWEPPAEFNNVSMICAFLAFTQCFLFLYHCCFLSGIKLATTKYAERSDMTCLYMQPSVDSSNRVLLQLWWRHQMETFPALRAICAGIHRSSVNSLHLHKGQWRRALIFSLISAWINIWVNNREAGDLTRYGAHYDVIVMCRTTVKPDEPNMISFTTFYTRCSIYLM